MESIINGENGSIKISEEVVGIIAGIAATGVEGVASMSGGIVGGIAEILGKNSLAKGVKVNLDDSDAVIDIFVIVYYGVRIPVAAFQIQEKVKKSVEEITGLTVKEVNVHVQGVVEKEDQDIDK